VGEGGSTWRGGGGWMLTGSRGRGPRAVAGAGRSTTLSRFGDCPLVSIH